MWTANFDSRSIDRTIFKTKSNYGHYNYQYRERKRSIGGLS